MVIIPAGFPGLVIIEPDVYRDERGCFFESYHALNYFRKAKIPGFVQDNESESVRGVIRGLHYQLNPDAQAKLVRVVSGEVFDVVVDLRQGSPSFGLWFGIILNGDNKKQLFIPEGFAHGFSVLSEKAVFSYKCTGYYNARSERSIRYDDPFFNIEWKLSPGDVIISAKDRKAPLFSDAEINFTYKE